MRVQKTDRVGGIPAPIARKLMQILHGHEFQLAQAERIFRANGIDDVSDAIDGLVADGYLEIVQSDRPDTKWTPTINGNALAMASFGKPIKRVTADRLVHELVERAKAINADSTMPVYIERLRVFGSYLNPDVDPLGDVDIELISAKRASEEQRAVYTKASGRSFNTYVDQLFWPEHELLRILRNRSAALNITNENVSRFTELTQEIFTCIAEDRTNYSVAR